VSCACAPPHAASPSRAPTASAASNTIMPANPIVATCAARGMGPHPFHGAASPAVTCRASVVARIGDATTTLGGSRSGRLDRPLSRSGRRDAAGSTPWRSGRLGRRALLIMPRCRSAAPVLRSLPLLVRGGSARPHRVAEPTVGSSSCPPRHRQTAGPSRSMVSRSVLRSTDRARQSS
jgi:hypothetical protein